MAQLPVIVITAHETPETRESALAAGAIAFLRKPFDDALFARTLETVLREADLLVIGAPHACYRDLDISVPVVDIWNLLGQGVRV